MPTIKKKPKSKAFKVLEHPILNDAATEEVQNLYARKKMSPKEYSHFLAGGFGHSKYDVYRFMDALKNHPLNTEKHNDAALKTLKGHYKNPPSQDKSPDDVHQYINEILENGNVSPKVLNEIIKNPQSYGYNYKTSNSLDNALKNQKNLTEENLLDLAHKKNGSLGSLIKHPAAGKKVAQALLEHDLTNLDASQIQSMISTMKHNDPNKRMLDNKDLENILFNGPTRFGSRNDYYSRSSTTTDLKSDILESMHPDIDEQGNKDFSKRKKFTDQILGIEGGRNANDLEDVNHPDHFAYDNWIHGPQRQRQLEEFIEEYKHFTPDQIDHIKRHGDHSERYALFKNPNIDVQHANEMYENWINDESGKNYNLEDLKDSIKEDHPYNDNYEDYHDDARQEAEEAHPLSDYTSNWSDEDWVDRRDFESNMREENPEASDEEVEAAFQKEVEHSKENIPDHVYEGYDDWIREDVDRKAAEAYDEDAESFHANYERLPDHLRNKLPAVDRAMEEAKRSDEENARIKAQEEEVENQEFLNQAMPVRDNKHAYGDLQHHGEMAKQYADANGGAIDIGQLHKLHPNSKDKWKALFGNKGKMSSQEIDQRTQSLPKTSYDVSYKPWKSGLQNINQRPQVVVRLDHSPESLAPLKQDEGLFNTFSKIQDVSQRSGHPTNPNTIAWARVDTTDPKHWMIDEVQSDFGSAARDYLDENGKDSEAGHVDSIIKYHKNWREALTNKVLDLARKNGAEKVSTHSPESKAAHTGADTVHTVYKDSYGKVPRSMGFRSSTMEELPLSETGKKTFQKGKATESVADRIQDHLQAAEYHAQMAQAHDVSASPGDDGHQIIGEEDRYHPDDTDKAIHVEHKARHSEKMRAHTAAISQLDPTHWAGKQKLPAQYLNKYHDLKASWGEPTDFMKFVQTGVMMAKQNVDSVKNKSLTGIPVIATDSALSQGPVAVANTGHTFDLTPQVAKKSLEEVTNLMKKEIDESSRTKIAMTLKLIKDNQEILKQIEQTNPEAHQAISALVQSMVKIFKDKTGEDAEALVHELEIKQQMEEQQAQMQQQQQENGQEPTEGAPMGRPAKDQPVHGTKMVYAPGSIRRYTSQDARVKDTDGDWNAFSGGLSDPDPGQQGQ